MAYKNKEDQAKCARAHYEKYIDIYKERAKKWNKECKERNKKVILNYLLTHPCVDCGETNPMTLEFDHIKGDKKDNISKMLRSTVSTKTLMEEVSKCEVRCANCHRIVTYKRIGNTYKDIGD